MPRDFCTIEGFWCESLVKLDRPIRTPLGGRVTILRVCVDIDYSVQGKQIVPHKVQMANKLGGGPLATCNVAAARRGEAWSAPCQGHDPQMALVVANDLAMSHSRLGRLMMVTWRDSHPSQKTPYLTEPFNVVMSGMPSAGARQAEENFSMRGTCEACGERGILTKIESGQKVCFSCMTKISES